MKSSVLAGWILIAGCGGPGVDVDLVEREFCDGSDDLTLAFRSADSIGTDPIPTLFKENGRPFIYLTGKCELWFLERRRDDTPLFWEGERYVEMSTSDVVQLLEDLQYSTWKGLPDKYVQSTNKFAPSYADAYSREVRLHFHEPTGGIRAGKFQAIIDGVEDAQRRLVGRASRLEGPVRAVVTRLDHRRDSWTTQSWPEDVGVRVEDVAMGLADGQSYCVGDSTRFDGAAADALRGLRDHFVMTYGSGPLAILIEAQSGEIYELEVRDDLPIAGPDGIVEIPGVDRLSSGLPSCP